MELSEAVVLVTGASGGIGAACAQALAARSAQVIIHGRDEDRLATVAAGIGAKALPADLTEPDAAADLIKAARDVFGRLDAVVHCVGVGWRGAVADMPPASVDELVAVNLTAAIQLSRAVLPEMLAAGHGNLTFLASIAGWTGVSDEAVYAAAKAGLITFADSLRSEVAGRGVGVSVISPAVVRTPFFDRRGVPHERRVPRPVGPDRVAAAVVRAVEHDVAHQMIPRWLSIAPAVRAVAPPAFRRLSRRFG